METRSTTGCQPNPDPLAECLAKHQVVAAMQNCSCIPFTYRYLHRGFTFLPYCNISHYSNCEDKLLEILENQMSLCNHKCSYDFYDWKYFSREPNKESSDMYFRVNLTRLTEPFIEFKITLKDGPEKFLAQVGGIVNLYLGFSGMSLCALVICIVDYLRNRYCDQARCPKKTGRKDRAVTREEVSEMINSSMEKLEERLTKSFREILETVSMKL